ncbi:MAG: hypothetical protein V3U24_07560 [Candidatus Neomarinimicrobiota bacterium]
MRGGSSLARPEEFPAEVVQALVFQHLFDSVPYRFPVWVEGTRAFLGTDIKSKEARLRLRSGSLDGEYDLREEYVLGRPGKRDSSFTTPVGLKKFVFDEHQGDL